MKDLLINKQESDDQEGIKKSKILGCLVVYCEVYFFVSHFSLSKAIKSLRPNGLLSEREYETKKTY